MLLLFVAVVCVGGAYALKVNLGNEPIDNPDIILNPVESSTSTDGSDIAVGIMKSPGIAPSSTPIGSTKPSPSPTTNNQPVIINMTIPLAGEIKVKFAMDKLVYNNTLKEWRTHSGIDIEAQKGAEVKSAAAGTIKDIKNDPRYGPTIIIEHESGVLTLYSGIETTSLVKVGQKVVQGEVIGILDKTIFIENAEPVHLHFEVQSAGKAQDPENYFK